MNIMASTNYCNECGASNPSQATYCFACNNALHTPALSPLSHVQAASINATVLEGRAIGPLIPSYLLHSRYTIVSQVGTGGFGAVYKAQDTLFSHRQLLPVYTVAWSPDGQHIASGDAGVTDGKSGTVKVWPVTLFEGNSQQPQPTVVSYSQSNSLANHGFKFPSNAVQAVAWSRDSRYIASVSHDIQIFDSFSGKPIYT